VTTQLRKVGYFCEAPTNPACMQSIFQLVSLTFSRSQTQLAVVSSLLDVV
jgi:hypothetical protein